MRRFLPACLVSLVIGLGCAAGSDESSHAAPPEAAPDSAYVASTEAWHAQRIERLRSETGWLTLVGLHPVSEGVHRLGAVAGSDIQLAGGPDHVGAIALADGVVSLVPDPQADVRRWLDGAIGEPFPGGVIATDAAGAPDQLATGSLVFYAIERGERFFLRVKDRQSPVLQGFTGIDRFPLATKWRVTARLEGEPGTMPVANVLGQVEQSPTPGVLVFRLDGQEYRLQPTGERGDGLFLVFGDQSNGHGSYPGGRFLVIDPPAADGSYVLDFNRAYNPPCVFTEFATCPLPGPENRLSVTVTAGEKMWGAGH